MGVFKSISKIGGSENPDVQGKLVVFDPQVFKRTKGLLTDWTANRDQWKTLFANWKSDFDASEPEYKANVTRENDYLKYLRDGGFEKTLSGLRVREAASDAAQKENALDFATGDANRAKLASGAGIGSSSADFARRLRAGSRIEADFGGRDTARERSDLNWATQIKGSTMGMINRNMDAMINRQLTPQQLSDSELISMVQSLGGIQGVRMGAAQPVFWRNTGIGEELAAPLDDLLSSYGIGSKEPAQDPAVPTYQSRPLGSSASMGGGYTPSLAYSEPYSAGMSYDGGAPSGGTMFNYSGGYARPAATGDFNNVGASYSPAWRGDVGVPSVGMSY